MRFDRFFESRDHKPSCEITIESTVPGASGRLYWDIISLLSAVKRKSMAKMLSESGDSPPGTDWKTMIEQACMLVVEEYRRSEPLVDLLLEPPVEAEEPWSIYPLARKGVSTLLYGPPGVGKGLVVCSLSAWKADGVEACGIRPIRGNVLYMDWEAGGRDIRNRLWKIRAPYAVERGECTVFYRPCSQRFVGELPEIQQMVIEKDIACIVIDSAAPAVVQPQDDPSVTAFFNGLRSLRRNRGDEPIDSIIIGHQPKNSPDKTPFGSTFWEARPRDVWWVNGVQNGTVQTVSLQHHKNNDGPKIQPFGLEFDFSAELEISVRRVDAGAEPELEDKLKDWQRIKRAIERNGGDASTLEIHDATGISESGIRNTLGRKTDLFLRLESVGKVGRWGIVSVQKEMV